MKVLVYEPTNQIANLIAATLIKNGIVVLALTNPREILPTARSGEYSVALLDGSVNTSAAIIQIIASFKRDPHLRNTNIISHLKTSTKELVEKMISMGICGFIVKPFNEKKFIAKFNQITSQLNLGQENKREQIRVTPFESLYITYRVPPHYKLLTGKVINISLGGLLFDATVETEKLLSTKQILKGFQIKLPNSQIQASALVVAKKGQFVALKFIELGTFEKNVLSEYIYYCLINPSVSEN